MRSAKLAIMPKTLPRLNEVYDVNILTHSIILLPLLDKPHQLKAPQTHYKKNPP